MKVSYKVLQSYLPYLNGAQNVANELIMHTAEVEEVMMEAGHLKDVIIGEVLEVSKHPESEKLHLVKVNIGEKILPIVCGAPNVQVGLKVPVATVGAQLTPDFVISKSKIRGEVSEGMICSLDELGLIEERQAGIWEMPNNAPIGQSVRDFLGKNDEILEIDNKAINHRPDMFSYMGVMREIATIQNKEVGVSYAQYDFSQTPKLEMKNHIPHVVKRYFLTHMQWVENIESKEEIQTIIRAAWHAPKGLLVDVSNYSLYFYGQPAHIFDADKVEGAIQVRYAQAGETLEALDDKIYELSPQDIVIADEKKVLALWGIIGGKSSAVSESTKNIYIETAHFDQAVLRMTGKRLGVRTDALNVFEKDIMPDTAYYGQSLIIQEIQKVCPSARVVSFQDVYPNPQAKITQTFDLNFYNQLIGAKYDEAYVTQLLQNLGIKKEGNTLLIPFWRKELTTKADIAEEIARIHGYDAIETTVPRINLGAVMQSPIYHLKNDSKAFFTHKGFFDVFNYSFVSQELLERLNMDIHQCVPLKNYLSEDATHMRSSLIPNLMRGLEDNIRDRKNIKLFEIEKAFVRNGGEILEDYYLSGVMTSSKEVVYYEIQNIVWDFLKTIFVDNFYFDTASQAPAFAHSGRVAKIIVRGQEIGHVGEVHPSIAKRFDVSERVGFFEINVSKLLPNMYNKTKAQELSLFQENNFDLSFVVDKTTSGREIALCIAATDKSLIKKVELFDIYENEEKLAGKRSLSFKIFIQSMNETLKDDVKSKLIQDIVQRVSKKGGELR